MAEDTQKAQSPVNDTQAAPMPSAQDAQKTPEQTVQTDKTQDGLPAEVSERTKNEFEKLQTQLREERTRREQIENSFKALTAAQTRKVNDVKPLIDPTTGLIDEGGLLDMQKKAYEADQRAAKAEQAVAGYLRSQEERVAYEAHPWLDPKNTKSFDQEKYNLAAGIALASMVNPERFGNQQLDLKGAGDYVSKLTSGQIEKVKEEAARQAIEQLSPKEQAALEATGTAGRRGESESALDYDTVRSVTRKGGSESITAIMARLRALKTQT